MDLPVDFQNASSSGFQSAIQVELRFLMSVCSFLGAVSSGKGNSAAAGGRKTKSAAA
jgi:hypothetical protein